MTSRRLALSSLPSDGTATVGRVNPSADTVELIVPDLGPAGDRAVIVSWSKRSGDRVSVDEPICRLAVGDLEFEVHSTADGELTRIFTEEGAGVLERSSLAQVAVDGKSWAGPVEADATDEAPEPPAAGAGKATDVPRPRIESIEAAPIDPEFAPVEPVPPAPEPAAAAELTTPPPASDVSERLPSGDDVDWSSWISPVVRMLADERRIDLAEVRGTGIGGRIRKRDVVGHAGSSASAGDA
jgi:pyruvate dehydrogenase E2 component (dihydrolipoamide acetyltransferase)